MSRWLIVLLCALWLGAARAGGLPNGAPALPDEAPALPNEAPALPDEAPALPDGVRVDGVHSTEGALSLEWDSQRGQAGYALQADGAWRLQWVLLYDDDGGASTYASVLYCGVLDHSQSSQGRCEGLMVGAPPCLHLEDLRPEQLPRTIGEMRAALNRTGWAVVRSASPAPLHAAPDARSAVLGAFFSGTPARILAAQGGWYQAEIGLDGFRGWFPAEALAFGADMDEVPCAFPQLAPLPYDDPWLDEPLWLVGVKENRFLLLRPDGSTQQAPHTWFGAGHG